MGVTDRELMRQALEALEEINKLSIGDNAICLPAEIDGAMDALRERLAQPEQEPVVGQPLPCPFCGHIGLDFSDGDTYRWGVASCGGCGASCGDIRREYPDEGKWHSEAIAEWNKRTSPPQRTWVGLMRGVRVEGDTVVITVKGDNEAARELCGALIEEMSRG